MSCLSVSATGRGKPPRRITRPASLAPGADLRVGVATNVPGCQRAAPSTAWRSGISPWRRPGTGSGRERHRVERDVRGDPDLLERNIRERVAAGDLDGRSGDRDRVEGSGVRAHPGEHEAAGGECQHCGAGQFATLCVCTDMKRSSLNRPADPAYHRIARRSPSGLVQPVAVAGARDASGSGWLARIQRWCGSLSRRQAIERWAGLPSSPREGSATGSS